ncbi:MAG: antiactivator of flagellar biosynthesis FleN protein [Burkholderiales bacterium]|nr:antiactivator of flagellar biosynthesis FleN protein [Burkholderiales bacterium]
MANFHSDQAEGLRRMLAGPRPRIFTFLSALPDEEKNAMLTNLGASLTVAGSSVLLLDARSLTGGVAYDLGATRAATLLEAVRQERPMKEIMQAMPDGFNVARLTHATMLGRRQLQEAQQDAAQARRLGHIFGALAEQSDVVLVDADLGKDDALPLPALTGGDIVVQVTNGAASIKSAYAIVKRLNAKIGRRPYSVLVTGANEKEARLVYDNMAQAASKYLGTQIRFLGAIPADEHLKRASSLGRTVVDAFPLAGASVAFRRLAGRCAIADMPGLSGMRLAG